jgi:uncharacterized spore protein YtfJ
LLCAFGTATIKRSQKLLNSPDRGGIAGAARQIEPVAGTTINKMRGVVLLKIKKPHRCEASYFVEMILFVVVL